MLSMREVLIPGTHVSGADVSEKHGRRGWSQYRPSAVDAFPTVNGTGVSARGCRT